MSGLAKKLVIFAAVDGLFLQPAGQRLSITDQSVGVKIEYGTNKITTASRKADEAGSGLESHGIVGLLNLVTSTYLIAIIRRKEVATIRNNPIFMIRDVALIPLSSRTDAQNAIAKVQALQKSKDAEIAAAAEAPTDIEDVGDETETGSVNEDPDGTQLPQKADPGEEARALEPPNEGKSTTIVKDVVQNKGKYGRFVSRWFSKNGSQANAKREQGLSDAEARDETTEEKQVQQEDHASPESAPQDDGVQHAIKEEPQPGFQKGTPSTIEHLIPRILKTARLYFSSSGFYFSYDYDLSASLSRQSQDTGDVPMWQSFDPLFFWNRHLMKPIIDAGQDALALPLIQGFVGQRAFSIAQTDDQEKDVVTEAEGTELTDLGKPPQEAPKHDLLLTLISRRSVKRAGLRYLRRGIDDEGNVANSVETEQILSNQSWNEQDKTFSLVQTRGSMPLFFSQSPYSFKPTPVFFGSEATNQAAMKGHFTQLTGRYGKIYAASLVDKHGTEVSIGEKYEKGVKQLNEAGGINGKPVNLEWFDFHGACKGMRFENVSILLQTLNDFLTSSGWTVEQHGDNVSMQNGVLRTNCMDCLDRTNVVQSAVAGVTLEHQLAELSLNIDLKSDPKTQWFNTLWADNGDAISKQYAGTSALKGDFTRTRKRNWTGALTDFSLTLNRYYNNIFGDYFLQTNIDYFLGAEPQIFDEFETDMTSQDYALDMSRMRQNAIDTCVKVVLEEPGEQLIGAWTLACPAKGNTLRTLPFEECVLLLTQAALYHCRIDWNTDKVGSFERVDLLDVKEIWQGPYVTSALGSSHLSETKNVGFVVRYADRGPQMRRTNTRSMSIAAGAETQEDDTKDEAKHEDSDASESRILAFKALPPRSPSKPSGKSTLADLSELDAIKQITSEFQKAIANVCQRDSDCGAKAPNVQEHDVISAADAKKSTGYVESLGYSLKKLVWS